MKWDEQKRYLTFATVWSKQFGAVVGRNRLPLHVGYFMLIFLSFLGGGGGGTGIT